MWTISLSSPAPQSLLTLLHGHHPSVISAVAAQGIRFWEYQLANEVEYLAMVDGMARAKLADTECALVSKDAEAKAAANELRQRIAALETRHQRDQTVVEKLMARIEAQGRLIEQLQQHQNQQQP
ncbi:hypothetical protein GQ42DRAFT_165498, partial [Ramicandelaber brevisporus]